VCASPDATGEVEGRKKADYGAAFSFRTPYRRGGREVYFLNHIVYSEIEKFLRRGGGKRRGAP